MVKQPVGLRASSGIPTVQLVKAVCTACSSEASPRSEYPHVYAKTSSTSLAAVVAAAAVRGGALEDTPLLPTTLALNHLKSTSNLSVFCGTFVISYHFFLSQNPLVDFSISLRISERVGGLGDSGVGGGGNDDTLARTCILLGIYRLL